MANKTKQSQENPTSTSNKSRNSTKLNNSISQFKDTRLQEKKDLQNLNDRLASYFNKVRELEKENLHLKEQLSNNKEGLETKLTEYKQYYENQLFEIRNKLESECTNSAKKLIDHEKNKSLLKEIEKEKSILTNDLNKLEKKNALLLNEIEKLKEKSDELDKNRKLLSILEQEKANLDKVAKKNLAQSESEKLKCISLESKLKVLEEQLVSQKHFYDKEIEDLKISFEEQKEEHVDRILQDELDFHLTEERKKMRKEMEEIIFSNKQEMENYYQSEIDSLNDEIKAKDSKMKMLNSELSCLNSMIDKLNDEIKKNNVVESNLKTEIARLQGFLEKEKNAKLNLLSEKEIEIKELRDEIRSKASEHQLAMDTNIQLNEEIRVYRSLLEEQEKNHSLEFDSNFTLSQKNRVSTPGRRYAMPRKRKRNVELDQSETTINNFSKGPIAIDASDEQYIKLVNRTEEQIAIGGWELKRENEDDGFAFKFHKSVIIKPSSSVTIWSSDAKEAKHEPPSNIKLKQNWPIGEGMVTTLSDLNKEIVAKWEMAFTVKKSKLNGVSSNENDKCSLM